MGAPPSLPLLTQAARPSTFEITAINEKGEALPVSIAGEYPLTLFLDGREIATLMTLGTCPEALALGYLRNQQLVSDIGQVASVHVDWDQHAVTIATRDGRSGNRVRLSQRNGTVASGIGTLMDTLMQGLESIRLPSDAHLDSARLLALARQVRQLQTIHEKAGAVHGCALAQIGTQRVDVLMFLEDVGRHNATDAVAGRMWLDGLDGADKVLFTTGRMTSGMVLKAAIMGIPFLISRNGITHAGWQIARQAGVTAIGRVQGQHYLVYTGAERFSR
ncbi:MAG: formate dehydrogenase accessory sulfurtransferase FdhD [Burkholderiaceae bacterium]|nr:formate dehydrogenase accessory sulfurtransferase FdhD [Burkholderiaceae bacterium]